MAGCDEEYDVVDGVRKRKVRHPLSSSTTMTRDVDTKDDDDEITTSSSSRSMTPLLLPLEVEYRSLNERDGPVVVSPDDGRGTMALSLLAGRILLTRRRSGILASVVGGKRTGRRRRL
jgi:hypothetical protein